MQKKFIIFPILLILLSACSQGAPNALTEKSAPDSMEAYGEDRLLNRIDDLKNGAKPKMAAEDGERRLYPEDAPPQAENSAQSLNTNAYKNMNTVVIKTNKGTIKVKLNPEKAPITVENFKRYAAAGFYSGTIFHRVIPGFMIQGGGFSEDKKEKSTEAPIKIESDNGLNNKRGTIAMARTQVPDSATSQFFINLVDNDFLNYKSPDISGYGYAVFGEVIEGMDVVDVIAGVETADNGPHQNWPTEDVVIESVELEA